MKKLWVIGILFLSLALVSSCASLPEKSSSEDSVVAIKLKLENNTPLEVARDLRLYFTDGYPVKRVQFKDGILYLTGVNRTGIFLIKSVLDNRKGFQGDPFSFVHDIEVPYNPGKISILPYEIRYNQHGYQKAKNTYLFNYGLFPLNQRQIDLMWEKISQEENFSSWYPKE